jgi:hypothetical protein
MPHSCIELGAGEVPRSTSRVAHSRGGETVLTHCQPDQTGGGEDICTGAKVHLRAQPRADEVGAAEGTVEARWTQVATAHPEQGIETAVAPARTVTAGMIVFQRNPRVPAARKGVADIALDEPGTDPLPNCPRRQAGGDAAPLGNPLELEISFAASRIADQPDTRCVERTIARRM